jgi:hypothetical protein
MLFLFYKQFVDTSDKKIVTKDKTTSESNEEAVYNNLTLINLRYPN